MKSQDYCPALLLCFFQFISWSSWFLLPPMASLILHTYFHFHSVPFAFPWQIGLRDTHFTYLTLPLFCFIRSHQKLCLTECLLLPCPYDPAFLMFMFTTSWLWSSLIQQSPFTTYSHLIYHYSFFQSFLS